MNIDERPEGLKIASIFIVGIVFTSMISRVMRSTELRVHGVDADEAAQAFIKEAAAGPCGSSPIVRIAAIASEYEHKLREASESHHLPLDEQPLFIEVQPGDVSAFSDRLERDRRGCRGPPRAALHQPGDPERDRGAAALHSR